MVTQKRALDMQLEFEKEIPGRFFTSPVRQENKADRLAFEVVKALINYRKHLIREEDHLQDGLDCEHDICPDCGAHLDKDEECDCKKK